ncbi:MAG: hypothetical protein C5B47_01515 [Verrucomicrobia bacterium]|nr:MAG: hypothetical protein C5B47_01515 [Verrucomicrobiota bacterium]
MMKAVGEGCLLVEGILSWCHYEPSLRFEAGFCAIRTHEGVLLIDPLPMGEKALLQLEKFGTPCAILLTNGNHQRASLELKPRWNVPILAGAGAQGKLTADVWLQEGQEILSTLWVLSLPGAGVGEIAVVRRNAFCIFGDFLIHMPSGRLELLPDQYCEDPQLARASLKRLRNLNVPSLLFAHGAPIFKNGSKHLQRFFQ